MGLSGKVLGAGLGWWLGGPLGAAIGGVIGHFVKDAPEADAERLRGPHRGGVGGDPLQQQQQEFYFVANLVGILTVMLKADGQVRPEEVRIIRKFFSERLGYEGESLEIVKRLTKEFLNNQVSLEALCADFRGKSDYSARLLLMECLNDVALADGHMHPAEQQVLDRAATLLGVEADDWRRTAHHGPASSTRAQQKSDRDILGVETTAGQTEIKVAYRDLVKKYHPDRVAHLGEEFKALAHQKFLEIQQAYDRLTGG